MCIRDSAQVGIVVRAVAHVIPGSIPVADEFGCQRLGIKWNGERTMAIVCVVVVCLLYTSDAADERSSVDLGGRRIIKKKRKLE